MTREMTYFTSSRRISGATSLFGIIGRDVSYSLSPAIHNALLSAADYDGVYLPFPVSGGEALRHLLAYARQSAICGFNVTIPYKEEILSLLDELDPLAQIAGAVNTITVKGGVLRGYNTDGTGFIRSLLEESQCESLHGQAFTILGAGGAARGIIPALLAQGIASLTIVNRTHERALVLADTLRATNTTCRIAVASEVGDVRDQWVVNTSSAGMKTDTTRLFSVEDICGARYFSDLVYTPRHTLHMETARLAGVPHQNGLGMLLWQAVVAFELFTGIPSVPAAARAALEGEL